MKTVFTTGEAAKVCKVSQQTIIRCFDSGQLKGFRVPGSRFRRIPRNEFENTTPIRSEVRRGGFAAHGGRKCHLVGIFCFHAGIEKQSKKMKPFLMTKIRLSSMFDE